MIAVTGCSVTPSILEKNNKDEYSEAMKPGYGLVVASFRHLEREKYWLTGTLYAGVYVRSDSGKGNDKFTFLPIIHVRAKPVESDRYIRIKEGNEVIVLSAYQLPSGSYGVTRLSTFGKITNAKAAWLWGDQKEVDQPYLVFDVKEGEVTYIGGYTFQTTQINSEDVGKEVFAKLTLANKKDEDISRLYKVRPELHSVKINDSVSNLIEGSIEVTGRFRSPVF